MADFKTHITVSTAFGVAYGAVAYKMFDVPPPTCVLAGTLCSVSGMLPDLDSDSGVPLRESLSFASACVPMLLIDRFRQQGWTPETMVLVGAGVYAAIRFGLGALLKRYTVHRGMFHSIPAALIAGEVAFLLCSSGDIYLRAYKACAVMLGFMSHLVLDEIYSVKVSGVKVGLKSSAGTAVKLWSGSTWANLSAYGKLVALGVLVFNDPIWLTVSPEAARLHGVATNVRREIETRTNLQLPTGILPAATSRGTASPRTPTSGVTLGPTVPWGPASPGPPTNFGPAPPQNAPQPWPHPGPWSASPPTVNPLTIPPSQTPGNTAAYGPVYAQPSSPGAWPATYYGPPQNATPPAANVPPGYYPPGYSPIPSSPRAAPGGFVPNAGFPTMPPPAGANPAFDPYRR